ncbi:hypothetical protein Poli38472_006609 [Pythium oligandrum]|uniref:Kinesin-like protein n=1 Tax=Pythium oligandrum TaxID=41045 RepID=A0A8K1C531_PYTOL|nr:hypothetical protein Poli38472_006609 [Pythium oligandrum]|eukprot:TMW56599.1 hypothetical protein Poli38472_006609 [Pythium oligandrum]
MTEPRKGAAGVRVCARFRPQNKLEIKQQAVECVRVDDGTTVRIGTGSNHDAHHTFTFDQVFGTSSTQAEVYGATAKPLVEAALQGYNCTCFVYGQTGTGKTFSMEGVPGDAEYAGIIPRVMNDIFDGIENMQAELEFIVRVSYIEIYLEKIRDLLEPSQNNLNVRESKERGVWIAGATEVCCASSEEMMAVMRLGGANRVISSTRMNNDSSRSHSVFIITIEQRNVSTGSTKSGKLFLVDLAGSEKVGKTHAKGQTLKEAQHINKSLSALGGVMNALTSGQPNVHVPYRDSKLTRLLQDSLGGNSETTLLVCGSCSSYNAEETLSTLRFGSRAKSIKNKPKVNEERTVAEYKQLLQEKEQAILSLLAQLKKLSDTSAPDTAQLNEDQTRTIQELTSKIEQLEDDQASKISEISTLEERVVELETKQTEWKEKELELVKFEQQRDEYVSKLKFVESELAAKTKQYEELEVIVNKQRGSIVEGELENRVSEVVDGEVLAPEVLDLLTGPVGGTAIDTDLLRQQLNAKTIELQNCTTRMQSLAEELENCRGFYEPQITALQAKLRDYEAHVKGIMDLSESDDKAAQLESLLQKSKMLRSVRGGGGANVAVNGSTPHVTPAKQVRDAVAAAAKEAKAAEEPIDPASVTDHYRPRFVSAASMAPDGWVLDEEIFPMAPIDLDSPIVQRLIASMPEKGREKMVKWLVFVFEGRDIRSNFHPEISLEGINDEISKDMRRLIIPLLKKRQDIDVESYVRTRFVKVADLKIKLVHRNQDTMLLGATASGAVPLDGSGGEVSDDTMSHDGEGSMDGSVYGGGSRMTGVKRKDLVKMWAREHLFYGPKSDPSSDSVLHRRRVLSQNPRVDRFVSEPVDMSDSILESKSILTSLAALETASTSSITSSRSVTSNSSITSLRDVMKDQTSSGRMGTMFNRLRARRTSMGNVLGDVKTALSARMNKNHVHEDTMCDGCGVSPIVGAKWKCNTCESFELCDSCYGRGIHGCEVSLDMCRRIEQVAVQKHRVLGNFPELFELLRAHICDDDVIQFRHIVQWLCDIVAGKPVTQLHQRSIVKSGLHPEIRARLVGHLGALASNRTDLELKTEWFIEQPPDEDSPDDDSDEGEASPSSKTSEPPEVQVFGGVALETLRMYVVDLTGDVEESAVYSSTPLSRKISYSDSMFMSITSEDSHNSFFGR